MRHPSSPSWLLVLLLVAGALSLQGTPSLQARVNKNILSLQEPLELTIVLSDDAEDLKDPPQSFPLPAGLPFQVVRQAPPASNHISRTQILNGRATHIFQSSVTYSYLVVPLQEGECTIPSLTLDYQGKTLRSEPITLQVTREAAPGQQKGMTYQMRLSRSRTTPGALVTLTLECLVPQNLVPRQLSPSLDLDALQDDFTISTPETTPRGQILWNQESVLQNGVPYLRISLEVELTPRRPGSYAIPVSTLEVLYTAADSQPDSFFGFMDSYLSPMAQETLISPALTLEVEDFPQEGRPDGFSGLLGPLQVTASVDQTTPRVGDPIQLTLRLQGDSLTPQSILPPWEKELESLTAFQCFGNDPLLPEKDGSLLLQRTLRPLQPGPQEIPAIQIPFYDPDRGQYGIAVSEPIRLQVQATEEAALPLPAQASPPQTPKVTPSPAAPGAALPKETSSWPALNRRTILWATLLPFTLLLLGLLLRGSLLLRKRHLASSAYRLRKARESLERQLETLETVGGDHAAAQAAQAWEEYLYLRFSLRPPVTAQALEEAARKNGLSAETSQALQELLTLGDAAQYGGTAIPFPPLKEKILNLLQTL